VSQGKEDWEGCRSFKEGCREGRSKIVGEVVVQETFTNL
jgi:hypothetical protein